MRLRCLLPIIIISSFAFLFVLADSSVSDNISKEDEESTIHEALLKRVLNQLGAIDLGLEGLAQAIHNNQIKVSDKDALKEYIKTIREFILKVRKGELFELNEENLYMLLEINKAILAHLESAVECGLKSVKNFEFEEITKRSKILTKEAAEEILRNNDQKLSLFMHQANKIGLSNINLLAQEIERFANKYNLKKIGCRVLPYFGLGLYLVFVYNPTMIESLPIPGLRHLKRILGSKPHNQKYNVQLDKNIKEVKIKLTTGEEITVNRDDFEKKSGSEQSDHEEQPQRKQPEEPHKEQSQSEQQSTEQNERSEITQQEENQPSFEKDNKIKTPLPKITRKIELPSSPQGILGTPAYYLRNVVKIETDPFINLTIGTIMAPIIHRDVRDAKKFSERQIKRAVAFFKGEPIPSDSLVRKSKITFKDIVGCGHIKSELSKIVDYFKAKTDNKLGEKFINKTYLLVGSEGYGQKLIDGMAGEITEYLSKTDKDKYFGVHKLHASQLISKKLKDVIGEVEDYSPCVILIEDLDWFNNNKGSLSPEVSSDLISSLNKVRNNPKLDIIIVATTSNIEFLKLDGNLMPQFGQTIYLNFPTDEERNEYLKKEFENRCIDTENLDLKSLVSQTENCTYSQLDAIIRQSISRSHWQKRTLSQADLEQSINEIIHKIVFDNSNLSEQEKQILSAHFAGKLLTYRIYSNEKDLIKVTILPVSIDEQIQQGALIISKPHKKSITMQDLEKQAIIELAGICSQKILLSQVSYKLSQETYRKVFDIAKLLLLRGLMESGLSKVQQNKIREDALDLVHKWEKDIEDFLEQNKDYLLQVANRLEKQMILSRDEISNILTSR